MPQETTPTLLDLPVARQSRVSVVLRCAYLAWYPEIAKACSCWRCAERREAAK